MKVRQGGTVLLPVLKLYLEELDIKLQQSSFKRSSLM